MAASIQSNATEVASIHDKLDQLIAAYSLANTPRSTPQLDSIFATAAEQPAAVGTADSTLATAESIAPRGGIAHEGGVDDASHEATAVGAEVSSDGGADAAQSRAVVDTALSPAPARAVPDSPAKPRRALSRRTTKSPSTKVRFSLGPNDDDAAVTNSNGGSDADSDATVLSDAGSFTSQSESSLSSSKAAPGVRKEASQEAVTQPDVSSHHDSGNADKSPTSASAVSAPAAASTAADREPVPLPAAKAKPRKSLKKLLQQMLN